MTPTQKRIVREKAMLNTGIYLDLLRWFIKESGHGGYAEMSVPEECPKLQLIKERDTSHNTDEEGDAALESQEVSGTYYFSSDGDPSSSTSIFDSTRTFATALWDKQSARSAPTLLVYGGRHVTHQEMSKLENVMPLAFPFGSGAPTSKRRTNISPELVIQHYLRLANPAFMRPEFVLIAYQMISRIVSYRSGITKLRPLVKDGKSLAEEISKLSERDIRKALKEVEKESEEARLQGPSPPPTAENGGSTASTARKFLKAVDTTCRKLGHTPEAAKAARVNSYAFQTYFGLHAIFLSISPDDECDFRVRLYACPGIEVSLARVLPCATFST